MAPETLTRSVEDQLEQHRRELTGYCYRMLGSATDAEDAVQETLTRAWRNIDRFEGRAALRTWLYKIASNVCFDALAAGQKRAMPIDLSPGRPSSAHGPLEPPVAETTWIGPAPDALVLDGTGDPAALAEARESVRLAFVAALQHLPPRQRAILILRDVLRWQASEVAELLHLSVAAVNSALQRARATLASRDLEVLELSAASVDQASEELLARYLDAFERYDMDALTALLHEDATQSMPPYPMWLRGREELIAWMRGPGAECVGSKLVPVQVNGQPGFAQYRHGGTTPWSIQVPVWRDGKIADITYFLETDGSLFALFGLPPQLDA
ncbi:sigma-70 family RNA polymerase sigma factor [Svornostia abyssi]|uniref:Sigma-70 family RNA polymerase sigma factor n=1 Tax=Svornostia abyssi TaxID=2898438 RepID=A0ABY5PJ11_9ACTN|nr:sigma-70 family RNA polymerase sigma factor [Parviterribacteraceae bacterium J379]